ncbi:hypothetical protein DFH27DRAFT_565513 [Peziza echinospora]|nr:hypothetical protein DFH27DRAFT_565513 [Peziza echinospora]
MDMVTVMVFGCLDGAIGTLWQWDTRWMIWNSDGYGSMEEKDGSWDGFSFYFTLLFTFSIVCFFFSPAASISLSYLFYLFIFGFFCEILFIVNGYNFYLTLTVLYTFR